MVEALLEEEVLGAGMKTAAAMIEDTIALLPEIGARTEDGTNHRCIADVFLVSYFPFAVVFPWLIFHLPIL